MKGKREDTPAANGFDPRVLVFACNWCSYAGADTAGVSRLAQTPHFRLLRVMCSGRIHPSFVLRAFARGADAVMVSGCHFGDCHYIFGNYRAVEQFEKTKLLVDMLGLRPERIRLEWISAAEGIRFAEVMNEFTQAAREAGRNPLAPTAEETAALTPPEPDEAVLRSSRVLSCLECGRCTAVCPVARYQRFSPRRLVSRTVSGGFAALLDDNSLWSCLTCMRCSQVCPTRVDYDQFVIAARAGAVALYGSPRDREPETKDPVTGITNTEPLAPHCEQRCEATGIVPCSHGGVFEQISIMHTRPQLRQRRLAWLTDDLEAITLGEGERGEIDDLLFTGCSPYFAAYFGARTGEGLTGTLRSSVRLLNRVGITPAILANERCCGYHLRLSGHAAEADKLGELVIDQIQKSGAKRVILFCPECLVTCKALAAAHRCSFDVVHLSQVLMNHLDKLRALCAGPSAPENGAVTYQDPCRLGRHSGLYDQPRDLLKLAAGELREMSHNRERAICCGNTAWLNCNAATKSFQTARLEEASSTGSRRMITACPGCFIHLRCAQEGQEDQDGQIQITDIWSLLDQSLTRVAEGVASTSRPGEKGHDED